MSVPFVKFNCICSDPFKAIHNFNATDHIAAYLTNAAPAATNTVYNTPADLSTAAGYTAGGIDTGLGALSGTSTVTLSAGATAVTWTFTGAKTFEWVVFYNLTAAAKNLIGSYDYGSAITTANGDTFTWTSTSGTALFTLA